MKKIVQKLIDAELIERIIVNRGGKMKILSVNAGSSSLKFQLYEMPEAKVLISGIFERIGINDGIYTIKQNGKKEEYQAELKDHSVAVDILLKTLLEKGVIKDLDERAFIVVNETKMVHNGYFK